jgi:hypothetical protein
VKPCGSHMHKKDLVPKKNFESCGLVTWTNFIIKLFEIMFKIIKGISFCTHFEKNLIYSFVGFHINWCFIKGEPSKFGIFGYCHEDNQEMLIYEFMHKGSLHDHLYCTINSYSTFDFEHLIDPQVLIHIKNTSLFIFQLVLIILLTFIIGIVVSVFFG